MTVATNAKRIAESGNLRYVSDSGITYNGFCSCQSSDLGQPLSRTLATVHITNCENGPTGNFWIEGETPGQISTGVENLKRMLQADLGLSSESRIDVFTCPAPTLVG